MGSQPSINLGNPQNPPVSLTLRDYFAAASLHGLLAANPVSMPPERAAEKAYIIADWMLKEREKKA